jgi:hypothetical protein
LQTSKIEREKRRSKAVFTFNAIVLSSPLYDVHLPQKQQIQHPYHTCINFFAQRVRWRQKNKIYTSIVNDESVKPSFMPVKGIRYTEVRRAFKNGLSFNNDGYQLEPEMAPLLPVRRFGEHL